MTTKEIMQAVSSGRLVTLGDDPSSCIQVDLFGDLVIVSRSGEDTPVRKATLSDKRKAIVKH
jgi:uncharacterized protein YbcI